MKLSSTWFALILIASALPLSGAPNVSAQNLRPNQSLTQQGNETAQQTQTDTETDSSPARVEQTPPPINSPSGQPSADEVRTDRDQYAGWLGKVGKWLSGISAQAIFNLVTAMATVLLAIFTWKLVVVTRDMHTVTKLALKVDRPYLILEHAQLTGVLPGDDPVIKEPRQLGELTLPPRFFPRVVLTFRNYGKGPVIFKEGLIRIDTFSTLPAPRDFSGCEPIGLQVNAVRAGGKWHPLAQFNFEADWSALFPDIAARRKTLIAYGCVRYTDPVGESTYETGFCWLFIPPRTELHKMPKGVTDLLAPYRAPGAPDPEAPILSQMPGDFLRGPKTHNYCD